MKKRPPIVTDSKSIFIQAQRCHWSYERLCTYTNEAIQQMTLIPAMMLSAFASELYLKCLHHINSGVVPDYGHDLRSLFENLPPLRKARIEKLWNSHTAETHHFEVMSEKIGVEIPTELSQALEDGALGFQKLRYEYEDRNFKFYISELPLMLHRAIIEIQPTWKQNIPEPTEGFVSQ